VSTISTGGGRGLVFFTRPQVNAIFIGGGRGFAFFSNYIGWLEVKEKRQREAKDA